MKNQKGFLRFFHSLSRKFMLGFFVLALTILTATCTVGYYVYRTNIQKIYNAQAYSAAYEARSLLDGDLLRKYSQTLEKDEEYEHLKASIETLRQNTGSIGIFIVQLDIPQRGDYLYLIDTYANHALEYSLGDNAKYPEIFKEQLQSVYYDGADLSSSYMRADSADYGENFFATVPLYDSNGEIVANIAVQCSLEEMHNTLRQYLIYAFSLTIALVIVILVIYLAYINHNVIGPIKKITRHAAGFIKGSDISIAMDKIHTGDEIETLADSIIQMEHDIHEYTQNLAAATATREHMEAESNVAKQIQQNLFPYHYPAFPERKDFDVYARLQSCRAIGGNFYNYFLLDDTHLCLFAGDVNGSGIPTLMFSAIAATLIRNYATMKFSPDRILANVNDELSKNNQAERTVDVFLAVIDLHDGQMTYVTAGKNVFAMLKSPGSSFTPLPYKSCFSLATIGQVAYPVSSATLSQGDMLFIFTKGIAATVNQKGLIFGSDYARDTLQEIIQREYSLKTMTDSLFDSINAFAGDTPQSDDSTVLLFRYIGI